MSSVHLVKKGHSLQEDYLRQCRLCVKEIFVMSSVHLVKKEQS